MRIKLFNLPLPYYGPENEAGSEKSEAERQRESIKVTSSNTEEIEEEQDENNLEENNKREGEEEESGEGGEEEAEGEGEEEAEEEKELTAEQKEINSLKRKLERLQKRVGKTAGERDTIRKELKEAKAALEAKIAEGQQPLTEEEVARRAKEMAQQELSVREFNQAQERLIEEATKIDKNFMSKINDLAQEVAPLPEFFIGALNDLDNGGAVLNYLSDNADEYEDLLNKRNPMKVMKGLIEISNKLIEAAKPKPKKISGAPPPPKAPKGNAANPDTLPPDPTKNMAEFVRVRNKQIEDRRKARAG